MHEAPAVVLSGGGTGGHLMPAMAIAEALRARRRGLRVVFVGAERGLEARVLPARGEEHVLLPVRGVDRGKPLSAWRAAPGLAVSVVRAVSLLRRVRPEAVVVTGGYAGGPAGLAAALTGVPLVLQEQNVLPGVTTRALSRWAREIFVAFPEASASLPASVRSRVVFTGNPVRAPSPLSRSEARRAVGLPEHAPVLLVTGGSQGARALNRAMTEAVALVAAGRLERPAELHVLWSTGPSHLAAVRDRLKAAGDPDWVHAHGFIDDVPSALAAADLAVSRAGAMTTAELLNQGLPAILVPLPTSAADHQARNAEALEAVGAALHRPERALTAEGLWAAVVELLGDPSRLADMGAAARARARPGAAGEIAARIEALLPREDA